MNNQTEYTLNVNETLHGGYKMKRTINLALMGLYVVTLLIGIIFSTSILTNVSTSLAIFTFLYVQNQERSKPLDEREKLIVERASSISFQVLLTLLIVLSVTTEFYAVLELWSLELPEFLSILMGLGFMTFVSFYEYYQERI